MNNATVIVLCLIVVLVIIVSFVGYMITTNRIIKEQERDIARLQTALKRTENRPETLSDIRRKYPQFGDF